jgi:hypothetical protein
VGRVVKGLCERKRREGKKERKKGNNVVCCDKIG